MKIVIAGAGEVGYHLAKLLVKESQNITIVDLDKERLEYIQNKIDVLTVVGDCTSFGVLRELKIDTVDIFIAVTELQNTNLTSAMLAKKMGAKKTIARVSNPEYLLRENAIPIMRSGIDSIISPEQLAAKEIVGLVEDIMFNGIHAFERGELYLVGIKIDTHSKICNTVICENPLITCESSEYKPIAIVREEENQYNTIIPNENTKVVDGDLVYFICKENAKHQLADLTGKSNKKAKNVIILGAGRIGRKTTNQLLDLGYKVKVIEREEKVAENFAEDFLKATVIFGDARDGDILEEANISETDILIAVTGRSETNIMASFLAKSKGVNKTIALVENIDYINLSQEVGISSFVNKKLLAADGIFKYVRKGNVLDMTHLTDLEAEVLEFKVKDNCKIHNKTYKELALDDDMIIAGVIRKREGIIINDNFVFEEGDKVVLFAKKDAVKKAEKLFDNTTILEKLVDGVFKKN